MEQNPGMIILRVTMSLVGVEVLEAVATVHSPEEG